MSWNASQLFATYCCRDCAAREYHTEPWHERVKGNEMSGQIKPVKK